MTEERPVKPPVSPVAGSLGLAEVLALTTSERRVFEVVRRYSTKAGCTLSRREIAAKAEVSPKSVSRALQRLENEGVIAISQVYTKSGGRLPSLIKLTAEDMEQSLQALTPPQILSAAAQILTGYSAPPAELTEIEGFADAWERWVFHKTAKTTSGGKVAKLAPMTPATLREQYRRLLAFKADGHNPVQVIEQALAYGWKGLFALEREWQRGQPKTAEQANDKLMRDFERKRALLEGLE